MGSIGNPDAARLNFRYCLFFLKKDFPEERADGKESEDDDGDSERGKFVEGENGDSERPEESEPEERAFFIDFPFETHIEGVPKTNEDERKKKKE